MGIAARVCDFGLGVLASEADRLTICTVEPTTFAAANTVVGSGGFCLGQKHYGVGNVFSAPVGSGLYGRKTTLNSVTDGVVLQAGAAAFWAIVDTVHQRLLATGPFVVSRNVSVVAPFKLAPFFVELQGSVSGNLSASGLTVAIVTIGSPLLKRIYKLVPSSLLVATPTIGFAPSNWWGDDGSANAPAGGVIPFPTRLNGYPSQYRPQWLVPGVHYGLGPASSIVLKDPNTGQLPAGVSRSGHTFSITGANVTLDGWDFSLNGGWTVESGFVSGNSSNIVIRNSKFVVGANNGSPIMIRGRPYAGNTGRGLTVENCTIDGGARDIGGGNGILHSERSGDHIVRYCFIHDAGCDLIHIGADTIASGNDTTMLIEFNAIGNSGRGDFGHPDQLVTAEQENGNGKLYGPIQIHHNLIYNDTGVGTQGLTLDGNTKSPGAQFAGGHIRYCTLQALTTPLGVQNMISRVALTDTNGTWDMSNNAVDPSQIGDAGVYHPEWVFRIVSGFGNFHGTQTSTGNWDLRNGSNAVNNPGQA